MSSIQPDSFGLGLRTEHYQALAEPLPAGLRPDWLEIISENYLVPGGKPLWHLERLRRDYPVVMHGVSLSIGSADPLSLDYLRELKALADRIQPAWLSDHLCWTGVDHRNLHDLLPMPYTEASLRHLCGRIAQVQELLQRPLVLENVSSYVAFAADEMDEASFVAELLRRSGCRLLLDVNNVYVSARNHEEWSPPSMGTRTAPRGGQGVLGSGPANALRAARAYIDRMPAAQVVQIHLAGHEDLGELVIDTHDHAVCPAVWELYAYALNRLGPKPSMIERDDQIPPLADLLAELATARDVARRVAQDLTPAAALGAFI